MDAQGLPGLTAPVAPVLMVSAAGLLFNGVQAKNLPARIRGLMAELRNPATELDRRKQVIVAGGKARA